MQSGVYAIYRKGTSRCYVGSSKDIAIRWRGHVKALRNGRHHSVALLRAWRKYGADAFELVVLERCCVASLFATEQRWIDALRPYYNVARCVPAFMRGRHHSPAAKARIADAQRGRVRTEEHKRKNREAVKAFYAQLTPEERRERMRAAFTKRAAFGVMSAAQRGRCEPSRACARKYWAAMREGGDALRVSYPGAPASALAGLAARRSEG